jgi:hypothetical protein
VSLSLAGSGALSGVDLDALTASGVLDDVFLPPIPKGLLPSGSTLQMSQAVKTDTFSTTSKSFTAVTGLSLTVTPFSSDSKILVLAQLSLGHSGGGFTGSYWRIGGGGADTSYVGNVASTRIRALGYTGRQGGSWDHPQTVLSQVGLYVSSPNSISPVTYAIEVRANNAGGTAQVNFAGIDSDNADSGRYASSITLIEVAA